MGEFERTVRAFKTECIKLKFWPEGMLNTGKHMEEDLPTPEEIQMALSQLVNFMPEGKVRDHIREHLEKEYKAVWKWFGPIDICERHGWPCDCCTKPKCSDRKKPYQPTRAELSGGRHIPTT